MRYATQLVTAPTLEPVTVAECIRHGRLEGVVVTVEQQADLALLISAARGDAEEFTGMLFVEQTWDVFTDGFPCSSQEALVLPIRPLQSITTLKYTDTEGAVQTLSSTSSPTLASKFTLDNKDWKRKPRIVPAYNESWPSTRAVPNAVEIRVVAGFALDNTSDNKAANVPPLIRQAIKLLAAHYFENREASVADAAQRQDEIALGYSHILGRFRLTEFA